MASPDCLASSSAWEARPQFVRTTLAADLTQLTQTWAHNCCSENVADTHTGFARTLTDRVSH